MEYRKIEIKSANDLPKEDDLYFVHSKITDKQTIFSFHNNEEIWLKCIDWYLQPVFDEQKQGELRNEFLNYHNWLRENFEYPAIFDGYIDDYLQSEK